MTSPLNGHFSPTAIHFFKIILRTSLASGILVLPKKFTRKYGDGMSNPVFLKCPDTTEWKIYWTKHDGEIWFQKGWKEFATYYSLDHGHLLFFEYEGTSRFDVHIFDNSALEIDYPSNNTHDRMDEVIHISDDDSDEILLEQLPCQKTSVKPTLSSPQPCKKMKNIITTDVVRSPNWINLHQHVRTRSFTSREKKCIKLKLDEDEGKDTLNHECSTVEQLTSTALKKAITFKSEHPSFLLVMVESFIHGYYLKIPPHFVERYLKEAHADLSLEVLDGRSWPVSYSAPIINEGWQTFASENNLNVGDVCVFEMIQKIQGHAFKVSIFRGAEEPNCPISQGSFHYSLQRSKTESGENANIDLSKRWKVYPSSTNFTGGSSSQRFSSHVKSEILTTALKEASKFRSENPFFMITLRMQEHVTRSPHVPIDFARNHFVIMDQNVMIQFRNKLWPVKLIGCKFSSSARLSAGWASFARENNLQPGDVCIFELVNRKDITLSLHVYRNHGNVMQ